MANYVKIDGMWVQVSKFFKKDNNSWGEITPQEFATYAQVRVLSFAHGQFAHSIKIEGPSNTSGESCSVAALYDNTTNVTSATTWSIISGSTYATISSGGNITILQNASGSNITVHGVYENLTAVKNMVVSYLAGSTTETETETTYDESGNTTTTTTTTTTNDDGSSTSTSTSVIYDESGNTLGSSETNVIINSDSSFTSTSINYDENGDAVDAINLTGDTSGNVNTQQVAYDASGNSAVTGYEIDTSESTEGGKDITGDGVNTEFVPFADDDCGFVCHIKFTTVASEQPRPPLVEDTEDTGSNWLYNIMSAKAATKLQTGGWPGFDIRWALKKTDGTGGIQFRYTHSGSSETVAKSMNGKNEAGTNSGNVYDLIITYDPELVLPTSRTTFSVTSPNGCMSSIGANVYFLSNNIDFTLGYATNMQGNPYRYSNVTIHEFSIRKICSASLETPEVPAIACNGEYVTLTCVTQGASIYYRFDGSVNYSPYYSPLELSGNTVIHAYSELMGQTSDVVSASCIYTGNTIEPPIITFENDEITLTCETPSVDIYYRLNQTGSYGVYEEAIIITADTIVEAYSYLNGLSSSTVSANCIYVSGLSAPVIICDGESVTISCATNGASIYYKLDDDVNYTQYSTPITITATTIVHAYSQLSGETSTVITETCVYNPSHDYSEDYLTFKALTNGTILWKAVGSTTKTIDYSINNGTWTSLTSTSAGAPITVSQGDSVRLRGNNTRYCEGDKNKHSAFWGGTATYDIEGNIMSLCYQDNFASNSTIPADWAFCELFKYSSAVSAEHLILPATTLKECCYRAMFSYAQNLITPPQIPATTLASGCCWYMFEYTQITSAPDLLATTLTNGCYGYMFSNCPNLSYIKCLATTGFSASNALTGWVTNVAASGTFVKDGNTTWSRGTSGIPVSWTIYNDIRLYDPEISCDGEIITLTCDTENAGIYYRLDETGEYGLYTDPIPITADTIVEAYSEYGVQTSNTISASCVYVPHVYKFAGLEVSDGPLYYGSNGYEIKDSWNYDSYNSVYGKNVGSYYFNFIEMGQLFERAEFTTLDGSILNELDTLDGWRLPTQEEWASIIGTTRNGATVNNSSNKHYALIEVTGITHANGNTVYGLLVFPDNETITGTSLSNMDNSTLNTGITLQQLNVYLAQGCMFLPGSGYYDGNNSAWRSGTTCGSYWSSIQNTTGASYMLSFGSGNIATNGNSDKSKYYYTVRCVKEAAYGEAPLLAATKALNNWVYGNTQITAPYSINAIDGHSSSYLKGTFNFETTIDIKKVNPTYLWFQHADQSASVYVDNTLVEKHWGGYNAFFVDISNSIHQGVNNVKVAIRNNEGNDLAPAAGDFNYNATLGYVKLLTSPSLPLVDYGYDGFHVTSNISLALSAATLTIKTTIPSGSTIVCNISDGSYSYREVKESDGQEVSFTPTISGSSFRLWNGVIDPHLYTITLDVYKNGDLYHRFVRPYGLRTFDYAYSGVTNGGESGFTYNGSAYTGFLLNGSPYFLRGVCMHNDIEGKANALTYTDIANDFNLIQELGCNFIRLAHYPHPKEVYDWCDQLGIIVQTEVPWVNKASSAMSNAYYEHLSGQMMDMVVQHYNHPSIVFWGLSNETTTESESRDLIKSKIEAYTSLIKTKDPSRWVGYVMSHNVNDPSGYYNHPNVDWFGGNIYVGWYVDKTSNDPTSQLNTRINKTIRDRHKPLAFSEYGCGGTQHCHSDDPQSTTTTGNYERHDIEYQMWLHEGHIAALKNFPQLLFTGQWQLFDIAVSNRNEGYTICLDGINTSIDDNLRRLNNKGLVERDHITKKDTFYLYKAEWSSQNFVHICGKDYTKKIDRVIKCYTNDGDTLSLYVNGAHVTDAQVTNHIAIFQAQNFSAGDIIRVDANSTTDTFTMQ